MKKKHKKKATAAAVAFFAAAQRNKKNMKKATTLLPSPSSLRCSVAHQRKTQEEGDGSVAVVAFFATL